MAGLPTTAGCPAYGAYRGRRAAPPPCGRCEAAGRRGGRHRPTSTSSPPGSSAPARPTASAPTPTGPGLVAGGSSSGSAVAVARGPGRPRARHRHRRVGTGAGRGQRHRRAQADPGPHQHERRRAGVPLARLRLGLRRHGRAGRPGGRARSPDPIPTIRGAAPPRPAADGDRRRRPARRAAVVLRRPRPRRRPAGLDPVAVATLLAATGAEAALPTSPTSSPPGASSTRVRSWPSATTRWGRSSRPQPAGVDPVVDRIIAPPATAGLAARPRPHDARRACAPASPTVADGRRAGAADRAPPPDRRRGGGRPVRRQRGARHLHERGEPARPVPRSRCRSARPGPTARPPTSCWSPPPGATTPSPPSARSWREPRPGPRGAGPTARRGWTSPRVAGEPAARRTAWGPGA